MTARPGQHITVTVAGQHWRDARVCLATIAAAAAWTYAIAATVEPEIIYLKAPAPKIDPRVERLMRTACNVPTTYGEASIWIPNKDGGIDCWEWRIK